MVGTGKAREQGKLGLTNGNKLHAPPGRNGADQTGHSERERPTIPDIVIRRLPIYVRTLRELRDMQIRSVSSEELAERIGVTAAQIRRDLSYFGKFGKQGKGYDTAYLAAEIGKILKLDRQWVVALAGYGNLGQAIAGYRGFVPSSFRIAAIFDHNERRIGLHVDGLRILSDEGMTEEIARQEIKIGIVAVPASAAQDVTERMIAGGVRAILNYAPIVLKVPPTVTIREIDPVGSLQSMTYYLDESEV